VDHGCCDARTGRLPSVVCDLLDVQCELGVFDGELILHLVNHPLVRVVFWLYQPEVIQWNIIPTLAAKHVEAFLDVKALSNLLSREDSLMDPHTPAVLIPVDQANVILRANRDVLVDLSVAVGQVLENSDEAVALASTDCL